MSFYLISSAFTLFLALSPSYTTLIFPEEVIDWVGAKSSIISLHHSKRKANVLVFELLDSTKKTDLTVITKNQTYVITLVPDNEKAKKIITIAHSKKESGFRLLRNDPHYKLYEGSQSLRIIPKRSLKVNSNTFKEALDISLGPPLFIEGELIHYGGLL